MPSSSSTALKREPAKARASFSSDDTDEALFSAYQQGQVAAFRVLVERHQGPVYRFCLRSMGNPEAAQDATQEIFLRVVKYAASWQPKAKFTTWMYTIARNFCIDESRKAQHRKSESLNAPRFGQEKGRGEERQDAIASALPSPAQNTEGARLRSVLDAAIAALPDDQKAVFCLREQAGLPFKEIATLMETGENTIKSRMRYALGALRKALEKAGFSSPDSS